MLHPTRDILIFAFVLGVISIGVFFMVRLILSIDSKPIQTQIARYPVIHRIGFVFILLALLGIHEMFTTQPSGPPNWWKRRGQREEVLARVKEAGGWDAIRKDCIVLVQTNNAIQWGTWNPNGSFPLPPSLAALKPQRIDYVAPRFLDPKMGEPDIPIVRISILRSPYYGLAIVAAGNGSEYRPNPSHTFGGTRSYSYRPVSTGIYEIY